MEKYLNDTVKTIQELIRIDSTNQPAEEGMPFGQRRRPRPASLFVVRGGDGL